MKAEVREVEGQLVLDDPFALGVARAVCKHNCKILLNDSRDRIRYFVNRMVERDDDPKDVLIVIMNVDDPHGGSLTDVLMPGQEAMWQDYRGAGEVPIARGLAGREYVQEVLTCFDTEAAEKLATADGVAVVVVDHGVAEVYDAASVTRD